MMPINCRVCGWDTHVTSDCRNVVRLTNEIHKACLLQWMNIVEEGNENIDIQEFLIQNFKWLTNHKVLLLKMLLKINNILNLNDVRRKIQQIYEYLAFMSIDEPYIKEKMRELIDKEDRFKDLEQYLYLIGQSDTSEYEDYDDEEEDNEEDENIKYKLIPVEISQSISIIESVECGICYDKQTCISSQCGHSFCESCIDNVLSNPDNNGHIHCAMCRTKITQYSCNTKETCDNLILQMFSYNKSIE